MTLPDFMELLLLLPKAEFPTEDKDVVFVRSTTSRFEQLINAPSLMDPKSLPIVTEVRLVQAANVNDPIEVTPSGMMREVRALHSVNA